VYNLATAAAAAGINKSTVLRHIKAGRISATRDDNGGWQIDPAEFHRTFPPLKTATTAPAESQRDATTDQLVAELRAVIADLRQDRDHWRTEAADWKAQAQRLIPPPQQAATVDQPPQPDQNQSESDVQPAAEPSRLRRAWRWMQARG
jgi:hypothetical protein